MLILQKRAALISAIIVLLVASAASLLRVPNNIAVSAPERITQPTKRIFVLDAGHGGADGGAVSIDGVFESQINLAITRRLNDFLMLLGQNTALTRATASSLADDLSASLRQQKVSDTRNRVTFVNGIDRAVLVSIHQNTLAGHTAVHGAQVFYSPTEGSDSLAENVQQSLNLTVNRDNAKNKKPIHDDVYLMNHVTCPAILIECGFLSNKEESQQLQEDSYQLLLATVIGCAVVQP